MQQYRMMTFVAGMLLVPALAAAQDKGKVGLTMGFPAAAGLVWHVTEGIALRPELSISGGSAETDISDSDSTTVASGISALFYVRKWDDVAAYVTPRYAFNRSSTTRTGPFDELDSSITTHLFSGAFGAQYFMGERFSVFGELGLTYQRSLAGIDSDGDDDDDDSAWSWGTRSNIGIVFYF